MTEDGTSTTNLYDTMTRPSHEWSNPAQNWSDDLPSDSIFNRDQHAECVYMSIKLTV